MTGCEEQRHALGALVLGGLDDDEERQVRAHVERCPGCRAEHAELAGLPALLELVRDPRPEVPERVRDRVVAAAARRHARRRWRVAVAAAAVVAGLVGTGVGWQLAADRAAEVSVALEDVAPFEAAGTVTYVPRGERFVVRLEVEGLEPLAGEGIYEAWLDHPDLGVVSIGRLEPGPQPVTAELPVDGPMEDFASFWVTAEPDARDPDHAGPTVLRAPVPAIG